MGPQIVPEQLSVEARTYQGVHKESNGYKLLASMGWKEGQGLGALGQGIREHVTVKKKTDLSGVGQDPSQNREEDWLASMSMFDKVLSGLKEVKAVSQVPLDVAAQVGSKVERDASKKAKTTLKGDKLARMDQKGDTVRRKKKKASKRKSEVLETKEEPSEKLSVSHIGRFQRQEESKNVARYSTDDLSAILGGAKSSPAVPEVNQSSEEVVDLSESECDFLHDESGENWWGCKFVRAGTLQKPRKSSSEMAHAGKVKINAHGFSENDQTNLYAQVHGAATSGRQGLGASSVKKVAGAKLGQGKKITFSSGDEGEESDGGQCKHPNLDSKKSEAKCQNAVSLDPPAKNVMPHKKQRRDAKVRTSRAQEDNHLSKVGWSWKNALQAKSLRKIASKTLKTHGGQLKIKKLCRLVKAALDPGQIEQPCGLEEVRAILKNCKKIRFDGKLAVKVK